MPAIFRNIAKKPAPGKIARSKQITDIPIICSVADGALVIFIAQNYKFYGIMPNI